MAPKKSITEKIAREKKEPEAPPTAEQAAPAAPEPAPVEAAASELPLGEGAKVAERVQERPAKKYGSHDRDLLARSIVDRVELLEKLAKAARAEGYEREAGGIERDARILKEEHLPGFTEQTSAPFNMGTEAKAHLRKIARQCLMETVRLSLVAEVPEWIPNKAQNQAIQNQAALLAVDLYRVLTKVAREARAQGVLDREVDEAAVIEKAVRGIASQGPK